MKLSIGLFTALLVAALASAAPTRLVILSEPNQYNEALPPPSFASGMVPGTVNREMRRPCPAHNSAISIANAFRQAFGLDLISTVDVAPALNVSAPSTHISFDAATMMGHTKGGDRIEFVNPPHHTPVVDRLHKAIMALGPWEGRAVAFVFGCGIGVILRFFFLVGLLSCRAFTRRRQTRVVDYYFVDAGKPVDNPPVYDLDVKDVVFDASEETKSLNTYSLCSIFSYPLDSSLYVHTMRNQPLSASSLYDRRPYVVKYYIFWSMAYSAERWER
ncbi:hypothetical protein CPB85DRAFT_1316487 [Mucidula mucida]|nr:hypothetical protein CPB85DRAFT_1316487 [Mucidula mucida]